MNHGKVILQQNQGNYFQEGEDTLFLGILCEEDFAQLRYWTQIIMSPGPFLVNIAIMRVAHPDFRIYYTKPKIKSYFLFSLVFAPLKYSLYFYKRNNILNITLDNNGSHLDESELDIKSFFSQLSNASQITQ